MFLYFCVIVFYFYLFSGFSNSTQEDTKCLLPKPSTIICDLWGLFEHTWMWDYSEFWPSESEFLVVGLELAGGGCSWTESGNRQIHSGLDSAEIKYINQLQILLMLGLQCNISLNLLNLFRYFIYHLLSILATVDSKTLECISMEMKRVAKWKLIESKTVRNSLVI